MTHEEQVRRDMEQAAKEQQCPVDGSVDAPLSHSQIGFKGKKVNKAISSRMHGKKVRTGKK